MLRFQRSVEKRVPFRNKVIVEICYRLTFARSSSPPTQVHPLTILATFRKAFNPADNRGRPLMATDVAEPPSHEIRAGFEVSGCMRSVFCGVPLLDDLRMEFTQGLTRLWCLSCGTRASPTTFWASSSVRSSTVNGCFPFVLARRTLPPSFLRRPGVDT